MAAFESRYRDASPEARRRLAGSPEAAASPELPALLRGEKDGPCRVGLLLAVARARTRAALPAVEALLGDLDPEVAAAAALASLVLDPSAPPRDLVPTLAGHAGELARLALVRLSALSAEDAAAVRDAVRERLAARQAEVRRAASEHAQALGDDAFLPGVLRATWLETERAPAERGASWLRAKAPDALLTELASLGVFQLPPTGEGQKLLAALGHELLAAANADPGDRAVKLAELRRHYTQAGTDDAMSQSGMRVRAKAGAAGAGAATAGRPFSPGWILAGLAFAALAWLLRPAPARLGPEVAAAPAAAAGPVLPSLGEAGARISAEGLVLRLFGSQTVVLKHPSGRGIMAIFAEGAPGWVRPGMSVRLVGTLRGYTRDPGSPAVVDAQGVEKRVN